MQATHFRMRCPHGEQGEYLRDIGLRPSGITRSQIAAAQGEGLIQWFRQRFAVELLFETLQQAITDTTHDGGAAVEALHHFLDTQCFGVIGKAQAFGQATLVIKTQAFLGALGHQVQAIAQATQCAALARQGCRFVRPQVTQADQRLEFAHTESTQRHPAQRMQVAQAAGTVLDVGFQVFRGVAETRMAQAQLLALGYEKIAWRPYLRGRDGFGQHRLCIRIRAHRPPFDQRGKHGLV